MPVRFSAIVPLSMTALLVGGCISMPFGGDDKPAQPAPLPAAPTGPVTQAPLPPPPATPPANPNAPPSGLAALDPALQGAAPAAAAAPPPPPADVDVGRADLLGGWTIAAAGDSCQLFMTLTTWSGGYRAIDEGMQQRRAAAGLGLEHGRQAGAAPERFRRHRGAALSLLEDAVQRSDGGRRARLRSRAEPLRLLLQKERKPRPTVPKQDGGFALP